MRALLGRTVFAVLLILCPLFGHAAPLTATVAFLVGNASRVDAQGSRTDLSVGGTLSEGDAVSLADKTSRLVLNLSDGTELRLKGKTEMRFAQFEGSASGATRKTRLELLWGSFWAKVAKLTTRSSRFEVKAGGMVCGVRGTTIGGWWDPASRSGGFYNFEGNVFVDDGNGPQTLPSGHCWPFHDGTLGHQRPNGRNDRGQFDFRGGNGGHAGGNHPQGGNLGGGLLLDLTQDLDQATSDTRENDKTTGGAAGSNAGLKISLDGPEGYGGNND